MTIARKNMSSKKRDLEDWQKEDAYRLKRIFDAKKSEQKFSQQKFAEENGLTSQALVWQYLNARIPLNASAAVKFAKGLNCSVAEFSLTLDEEVQKLQFVATEAINVDLSNVPDDQILAEAMKRLQRRKHSGNEPDKPPQQGDSPSDGPQGGVAYEQLPDWRSAKRTK